jgi:VanZ family protein
MVIALLRLPCDAVDGSVATEATQLLSHGRFPSTTDVTCNVAGAWGGAVWAHTRTQAQKPPES